MSVIDRSCCKFLDWLSVKLLKSLTIDTDTDEVTLWQHIGLAPRQGGSIKRGLRVKVDPMTTQSTNIPTRRLDSAVEGQNEAVPTLFRIPRMDLGSPVPASPSAASSSVESSNPVTKSDSPTLSDTDVSAAPPVPEPDIQPPPVQTNQFSTGPSPVEAPRPSFHRVDSRHDSLEHSRRYNDLPSLPPLDNSSESESRFFSRTVVTLLFLAVVSVAIIATRDNSPISNSIYMAEEKSQDLNIETPSFLAEQPADDSTVSYGSAETPGFADYEFERGDQFTDGEGSLNEQNASFPTADSEQAIGSSDSDPETSGLDGPLERGNDDVLPTLPELALNPSSSDSPVREPSSSIPAPAVGDGATHSALRASDIDSSSEAIPGTADPISGFSNSVVNDSLRVAEATSTAMPNPSSELSMPSYVRTATPEPVTDWSRYYEQNGTIGYQGNAVPRANFVGHESLPPTGPSDYPVQNQRPYGYVGQNSSLAQPAAGHLIQPGGSGPLPINGVNPNSIPYPNQGAYPQPNGFANTPPVPAQSTPQNPWVNYANPQSGVPQQPIANAQPNPYPVARPGQQPAVQYPNFNSPTPPRVQYPRTAVQSSFQQPPTAIRQ